MLTVRETAEYLRIPLSTIYYFVNNAEGFRPFKSAAAGGSRYPLWTATFCAYLWPGAGGRVVTVVKDA